MSTAIVALEGVLKTETGDPIPEGIKLYRILAEHYRVVFSSTLDFEKTDHWLRSNLIIGYSDIYDTRYFYEGQELVQRHIDIAKSKGKVSLFISSDGDACAYALANGIAAVMFASPKFIKTKKDIKAWDELSQEVERQRQALLEAHLNSSNRNWRWE
jgi:hypothetical protein